MADRPNDSTKHLQQQNGDMPSPEESLLSDFFASAEQEGLGNAAVNEEQWSCADQLEWLSINQPDHDENGQYSLEFKGWRAALKKWSKQVKKPEEEEAGVKKWKKKVKRKVKRQKGQKKQGEDEAARQELDDAMDLDG